MTNTRSDSHSRAAQITKLGRISMQSQRDGETHVIDLGGELDLVNVAAVEQKLQRVEASDARTILIDLSGLTFIDSTGIRLLILAEQRSRADSDRLVLLRPPEAIQRVLRLAGVDELLPFAD